MEFILGLLTVVFVFVGLAFLMVMAFAGIVGISMGFKDEREDLIFDDWYVYKCNPKYRKWVNFISAFFVNGYIKVVRGWLVLFWFVGVFFRYVANDINPMGKMFKFIFLAEEDSCKD